MDMNPYTLNGRCRFGGIGSKLGTNIREKEAVKNRLAMLRRGPFGTKRQEAKEKIWEAARTGKGGK